MSEHRPAMKEILQKTMSVTRELEALQREHQRVLSTAKIAEEILSSKIDRYWGALFYLPTRE